MTRLSDIPVRVEGIGTGEGNFSIAKAALNDIAVSLARLVSTGKAGVIDLGALPRMEAATYRYLKDALSAGEVTAVVDADVRVEISETQYPGVWWLTHRNARGAIVTETIEIAEVPQILKPQVADIRAGFKRLEHRLAASGPPDRQSTQRQTAVA